MESSKGLQLHMAREITDPGLYVDDTKTHLL